jgi:hypothetical protein
VFSPGALVRAVHLTGINFMQPIIDALERKVDYMSNNSLADCVSNQELATL